MEPIEKAVDDARGGVKDDQGLREYFRDVLNNYDDAIEEVIRRHRDYERACQLAWSLYMAAMGVDLKSFRGIPGDGPEEVVKARIAEYKRMLREAYAIIWDSADPNSSSWVKGYLQLTQGQIELSSPDRKKAPKTVPGACGPECGEMHTFEGNCRMSRRTDS